MESDPTKKTDAINKLEQKPQNIDVFSRCHPILRNIHTEVFRKDRQLEETTKKGTKWNWTDDDERNTDFNRIKQELTSLPCLAHYKGSKENMVTTHVYTGLGVVLWLKQKNGDIKLIAFASCYLQMQKRNFPSLNWKQPLFGD